MELCIFRQLIMTISNTKQSEYKMEQSTFIGKMEKEYKDKVGMEKINI